MSYWKDKGMVSYRRSVAFIVPIIPLRSIVIQSDIFNEQTIADDFITRIHEFGWQLEFRERRSENELFVNDERGIEFPSTNASVPFLCDSW
jgi:hypothetical protein